MRKKYIVFTLQICVMGCCQKGSGQASCQPWEANRNCFQWLLDKVIESEVQGDGHQSELVAWGPMSTSSHPEAWALRKNIDVFGLILPKRKRGESFNSEESWILPHKGKLWTKWKGSWSRSYNDSSQQGVLATAAKKVHWGWWPTKAHTAMGTEGRAFIHCIELSPLRLLVHSQK